MKKTLLFFILPFTICVIARNDEKIPNKKILILGNSITHHGSVPTIGWYGDWGMAASAQDKDFVHQLIDTLRKSNPNEVLDYKAQNIAYWEQNFEYDFSQDSIILLYKPDLLIIRLGENVKEEYARNHGYENALSKLILKFKSKDSHVIVTSNFWPSAFKDSVQEKVAIDNGYAFVSLFELSKDSKNQAVGNFKDGGVAAHPSDLGMQHIALKIFKRIKDEKWY